MQYGETSVGDEYWPHYQLSHQEKGAGCLYEEMLSDGWEEVDSSEEEIVVSSPGMNIPDWCGSVDVVWQLCKKEVNEDECKYLEVGLVDLKDSGPWGRWYDSGFSEDQPED